MDISIHALLAESDNINSSVNTADQISIHALLAESDPGTSVFRGWTLFLSTLSLRRATISIVLLLPQTRFLSTLSLRRATFQGPGFVGYGVNFYPRSPCGERHLFLIWVDRILTYFYPRSPCGERLVVAFFFLVLIQFLSTLSLRRATCGCPRVDFGRRISIHALLAESDLRSW